MSVYVVCLVCVCGVWCFHGMCFLYMVCMICIWECVSIRLYVYDMCEFYVCDVFMTGVYVHEWVGEEVCVGVVFLTVGGVDRYVCRVCVLRVVCVQGSMCIGSTVHVVNVHEVCIYVMWGNCVMCGCCTCVCGDCVVQEGRRHGVHCVYGDNGV